jgi:uncharacterized phage protein (TIGR02216 family)
MAFGLGHLRWPPETFWAASPREIFAASEALRRVPAGEPPARGTLQALMRDHPDSPTASG